VKVAESCEITVAYSHLEGRIDSFQDVPRAMGTPQQPLHCLSVWRIVDVQVSSKRWCNAPFAVEFGSAALFRMTDLGKIQSATITLRAGPDEMITARSITSEFSYVPGNE